MDKLTSLLTIASLAACVSSPSAADDGNTASYQTVIAPGSFTQAPPASAGDITPSSAKPAVVAALRAEGPRALERLLSRYDRMSAGAEKRALAATIDKVAAQRYATFSRIYWYTDLEKAKAAAKRSGKHILSLRMLGRLDEDLSCANSRIFRIVLYANSKLSKYMRDKFVMHWSSERPAPRVRIDYGNGRVLERTITGNSIHYVLDADGRPVDAIPGVYAPVVFEQQLEDALAISKKIAPYSGATRQYQLGELHRQRMAARMKEWKALGAIRVPSFYGDRLQTPAEAAQLATVTKSGMEVNMLRTVSLGVKVGDLRDDPAAWAQLGLRLLPGAMPTRVAPGTKPAQRTGKRVTVMTGIPYVGRRFAVPAATSPIRVPKVLDDNSRALIAAIQPMDWKTSKPASAKQLERIATRLARDVVADTAKNEFAVRVQIRGMFQSNRSSNLTMLNRDIYAGVFNTPATDPWIGLSPGTFVALPRGGLVTAAR
jgi:hypothetical protein